MNKNNIYLKQVLSLKSYLKSKRQHFKQKQNWQKYRFNYMNAINSFYRINPDSRNQGFLSQLINIKKRKMNENLVLEDLDFNNYSNLLKSLVILQESVFISDSLGMYEDAEYLDFVDNVLDTCNNIRKNLNESMSIALSDLDFILWLNEDEIKEKNLNENVISLVDQFLLIGN